MKTILTLIIGLVVGTLGLSSTAEAGSLRVGYTTYYTSGHHSCGCPIRMKKVFVGYARCGTPVFRYYRVSTSHACKKHRTHRSGYRDPYYHRGYDRRRSNSYYHNRRGHHRQRG